MIEVPLSEQRPKNDGSAMTEEEFCDVQADAQ